MPNKILPLIIIVVIILIIFGPRRLPELGSSLGEAMKSFKQSVNEDSDEAAKKEKEKAAEES